MTKEDFWTHKIKAFLSTSPATSLFSDDEEQTKQFIATSLGLRQNEIDVDSLKDVHAIAKGFDIPPFIENFPADVFQDNPLFKHPLSGEKIKLDLDVSRIDQAQINQLIVKSITEIRSGIVEQQKSTGFSDEEFHKRLFFALWRKLSDVIRQKEFETGDVKIGKYWDWLPADPLIPTHSVWEHSSIVSAIAGAESEPALLIFTIASPQQFISTARRTQDSWMGSFMYSFLMWEAIKHIADEFGPDCFLFPDLRRQPLVDKWLDKEKGISGLPAHEKTAFQIANFPNMLTAILPFEKAAIAAAEAHLAMQNKWKEIAGIIQEKVEYALREKLKITINSESSWNDIWKRQTEDFLNQNVFWVVCPWQDDGKNALEVYKKLFKKSDDKNTDRIADFEGLINTVPKEEINAGMMYQCFSSIASRALTARKNLRDFHNQNKEEGEKCSLCGIRETLHPASKPDFPARYPEHRTFWRRLGNIQRFEIKDKNLKSDGEEVKFAGRIKRGDALCAVCLIKRLALDFYFNEKRDNGFEFDRHLFPSTSTISTAPAKAKILEWSRRDTANIRLLQTYVQKVTAFLDLPKINLNYPSSSVPKLEKEFRESSGADQQTIKGFIRLDGQWLIKDSFYSVENELNIKISDDFYLEEARGKAVESLENLLIKFKKEFQSAKPSSYYAVISMDGDKIGDWLNGNKAPTIESLLHPNIVDEIKQNSTLKSITKKKRPLGVISHLSLSIALKNFALEIAPRIIEEENYGKLIFAGGDDLLAFVPVENLLKVIDQLHRFFQGKQSGLDAEDFAAKNGFVKLKNDSSPERDILVAGINQTDRDSQLTASIGVAIIHQSFPLPQAIEEAFTRAMKENAKEKLGRNAVAFHLLKRAGSPLEVGFKFDNSAESEKALSVLQKLLQSMKKGFLSTRIAYAMNARKTGLNGSWLDLLGNTAEIWWHDAQKQTLRHLVRRQTEKSEIKEIEKDLIFLLEFLYKSYRKPFDDATVKNKAEAIDKLVENKTDTGWDTLTGLLLLLKFLAGEEAEDKT